MEDKTRAIVQISVLVTLGLLSLILSCAIPGVWWNLFIILPLLIVPFPWFLFGRDSLDGGGGWKSFSEFFSGFLFSACWALVIILYHLGRTGTIALALGIVANILVLVAITLFFYHQTADTFGSGF